MTTSASSGIDRSARGAAGAAAVRHRFLEGGGEMGARMRRHDWSATPLGTPDAWPQSLKTIVRVMLDSRYAMWMLWGADMTFFCNDAYLPTVGIKRDWVLGARADRVWEEIWPDIGPRIERVLGTGEATWDEGLLLCLERSGYPEETYHTFSYSPVYDDHERVAGMLCVVTEVTERVIGERRLRVLRDLAARAAGVDALEDSCRVACEVLHAYPLDVPFAGLFLFDEGGGAPRPVCATGALVKDALEASLTGRASAWAPLLARMRAGDATPESINAAAFGIAVPASPWPEAVRGAMVLPLRGAGSGIVGFLVAGCTPRRALDDAYRSFLDLVAGQVAASIADAQAYEAERRRAEALAEIDRAKTAFFSNVSHEFRTPLTLMLGPLEDALADDRLPDGAREGLELALRNAARLQRLVNTLLDFSRIEAGRAHAAYAATDLAALTRDLASTFRSAMERADLALEVDCAELPAPAYVDREMWEKIVLNLLSNAFKFTLQGRVVVQLRAEDGAAVLEVRDTGVGIPATELPRLFERFHRVAGTEGRTHEGSGIGLALVQELVRLHGGRIEARSTRGRGTTFIVRVPLGADHLPAERIVTDRRNTGALHASVFVEEALRWLPDTGAGSRATLPLLPAQALSATDRRFAATYGSRVLAADDNADMRAYLEQLLAPYYAVETVPDGAQALAAARATPPDLILSDVMMPRLDGFGLLAAVRADESLRGVPVVLLSARAGEESRIEGFDAGADDYVIKPFPARELLARIGALLELRRMRRAADESFRLRTEQFETLLAAAPLGVYLVDADLRIRAANPTAREVFGAGRGGIGDDFADIVRTMWSAPHAERVLERFRHTLETGEAYVEAEHVEQRRDRGVTECYEWRIHRIPLPDGASGVVCYFRDIAAQVQFRATLRDADRQKDEFLAMLAHELRNPLAPIRNAGEILGRVAPINAPAQAAVAVVRRQVGILTRLVDDLLDVSRITQGRIELQPRTVALADVLAQAVETAAPLISEKGHAFTISADANLHVHGDPARLVQCVANLLNNAAKYTPAGGSITLGLRAEGADAAIAVSDDGIGIPPELQRRVFELFVQGDRALDRAQGGLGIGLSLVRRLVELHGGSVSVTSGGRDRGARFEIRLPLTAVEDACENDVGGGDAPPRRILVVDDNTDSADSLAMILRLDGHDVEAAYSAEDALLVAERFSPQVGLLDIGLPGMDGYALAERLRASTNGGARMQLIALTGYGRTEDRACAERAGFDEHLVKPVDLEALRGLLAQPPR